CGSGRDTKAFLQLGFKVESIDASPKLARLATKLSGQDCRVRAFQDMDFREKFDGVWACASLLHVSKCEMHDVMSRFAKSLKSGGVFYISLKRGDGEGVSEDGRFFNYYTAESFRTLLSDFSGLREMQFWETEDVRPGRHRTPWLNFILK